MSSDPRRPATWLAEIYTPRAGTPHPVEPAPDVARHVAGLVVCLMLLLAVLALSGAVLNPAS